MLQKVDVSDTIQSLYSGIKSQGSVLRQVYAQHARR